MSKKSFLIRSAAALSFAAAVDAVLLATSSSWIFAGLAAAALCAAAAAFLVARAASFELRGITRDLRRAWAEISAGSRDVALSSQAAAQGATEQASTLEQTSASLSEITALTRKNAENMQAAAGVVAETNRLVDDANRNLEAMVGSMKEINASSERISKIIRVIDEIAFQTNILALNAAVEAARAGEAGMGFAVVADEVRNLAQRSAQAAKDTAGLIEESIAKSNAGSAKLDQVAESVRRITGHAAQVKQLVDNVDGASQQQARGIEQIAAAAAQMEQVTQTNAASAERTATTGEELESHLNGLTSLVEKLQRLSGAAEDAEPVAAVRKSSTPKPPAQSAAARKRAEFPLDRDEAL